MSASAIQKLHDYQGLVGRLHSIRDVISWKWDSWKYKEQKEETKVPDYSLATSEHQRLTDEEDYSHIYRSKSRCELVRISSAVMGIEFAYAAETAFVSPTLLKIGVQHKHMTMVWALSPLVGFFLTPILGSVSDKCRLRMGRRRPFILLLSLGVLTGLLMVPNGEAIGRLLGDRYDSNGTGRALARNGSGAENLSTERNRSRSDDGPSTGESLKAHPWSVFFTVLGTVLLDFDADACQSPSRAYLLDVTITDDHARGLSSFTLMAGLGGSMGYALGGINWDTTALGSLLGGHVRAVFSLITIIFIICVIATVTSFKEIPLDVLLKENKKGQQKVKKKGNAALEMIEENSDELPKNSANYGATVNQNGIPTGQECTSIMKANGTYQKIPGETEEDKGCINYAFEEAETSFDDRHTKEGHIQDSSMEIEATANEHEADTATLRQYLLSIVFMPPSLRILCLTNFFCWMAHVCYSLYFTDFVGEAVFQGNPKAEDGSVERDLYEDGVRFGCWGMSMYSLSCCVYSMIIEKLVQKFRARPVYIGGQLVYSVGMLLMAVTRSKAGVIIFSWAAGVLYSTLFTLPYLLVARYHTVGTFSLDATANAKMKEQVRGLGTDVAIVGSMVFLAQFILSTCMGSIVTAFETTTTVVSVASFLGFCGAISASQVLYLDL